MARALLLVLIVLVVTAAGLRVPPPSVMGRAWLRASDRGVDALDALGARSMQLLAVPRRRAESLGSYSGNFYFERGR